MCGLATAEATAILSNILNITIDRRNSGTSGSLSLVLHTIYYVIRLWFGSQ